MDLCREAILWRSLTHRFILPFLGIYEGDSQLSLVSPFMPNGTLTEWRKDPTPGIPEIHRLVRLLWSSELLNNITNIG
jgi:serine/threonine protein kinase